MEKSEAFFLEGTDFHLFAINKVVIVCQSTTQYYTTPGVNLPHSSMPKVLSGMGNGNGES